MITTEVLSAFMLLRLHRSSASLTNSLLGFFHSFRPSRAMRTFSISAFRTSSTAFFGVSTFHSPSVPKIRHRNRFGSIFITDTSGTGLTMNLLTAEL
uniref:Putative secreted protein n=1 Tax=Anopheles darlingi TaxID=43151 RepID=A0A2M4DH08_ANODA